jgi:hypothetical protein
VRNALILLAVVALLILVVGALNNGTAFDIDYVAGTVTSVSLLWVSAVIAALVFVVGLAAAWFAQAAVAGRRRKLEAELQSTYERLREAEALAARPAPAVVETAPVAATIVAEPVIVVAPEQATVVPGEDVTVVAVEDETIVAHEETIVALEDETVVVDEAATEVVEESAAGTEGPETVVAGEQTAVTMTGAAPEAVETAPADAGDEDAAAEPRGGEPGPSGS